LKNSLQVVAIDLDHDDDAQVIFETLNARGEPLLPADLLRNFIFLRAARRGESQETLYEKYWRQFDEPFWREEVSKGRSSATAKRLVHAALPRESPNDRHPDQASLR
jgi:uncharacterized protein with ParB-like and HNH nuclease domain